MNEDIRAEYKALTGTDPLDYFKPGQQSPGLAEFLQYRSESVRRMQSEWMQVAESMRSTRPWLDVVLTHVDDRLDPRMRELIGADAAKVLPMLNHRDFTFLVEDPATVWNLGPARYTQLAGKYKPITPRPERLAIDINIVERYQDVYPTKQQTGTELMQLVHVAAKAFPRVALYFENSIARPDIDLLPAAAAGVTRLEYKDSGVIVESPQGAGVRWAGTPLVDGKPWPVVDSRGTVWLPKGAHVLSRVASKDNSAANLIRVENLNAELRSASTSGTGTQISYEATSRATAVVSRRPASVEIDGQTVQPEWFDERTMVLPRGQHVVILH